MRRTMIVCVALGLLSVGPSMATTVWNPAANDIYPPDVGNWNDAANWTLGVPATPTNNDTKAVFNVDNAAECHVTDYQTGFYFVQGDGGTSNGTVVRVKSGGHIETSSVNSWSAVGYNRAAHMIVETGGELTTASGQHLWIGLNDGGVGTVDINGGTVTCGQMLGLGWGGGIGFLNVNDGGTLNLTQIHGDGQTSVKNGSLINITGTGQIVYPGSSGNTNRLNDYVANELLVANGVPEDVIINYDTNLNAVVVTAAVVVPDPPLNLTRFDQNGGTLAFQWSDIPGKQFDLISSEDLAVPVDTWAPYNDGVTTHENIPNSGTGTNTLTGVLPVGGPPRFFTVRKEFGQGLALFAEDFDTGSGLPDGWTSGGSGSTAWEVGVPSSVGPAEANSLSNCVATGIAANYGPNVDIWLRTSEIDLAGVTEGSVLFEQSRDIESVKDSGRVRVLKASDGTQLGDDLPFVAGGSDGGDWVPVELELPVEALGEIVKIEFQFQSDAANGVLGNTSFEAPVLADNEDIDADGPTWVRGRYDGTGTNWFDNTDLTAKIWNPDTDTGFAIIPDGENVGVVTAKYDFDTAIKQDLPINLEANTQYDLSFHVGSPYDNGDPEFGKKIPDYRVELVAGRGSDGIVVASETGASPTSFINQWAAHSLSYNSGATPEHLGEPLEIRLVAVAKGTSTGDLAGVHGQRLAYDNLILTIAPDPGNIGLAGWYIDDVEVTGPIP